RRPNMKDGTAETACRNGRLRRRCVPARRSARRRVAPSSVTRQHPPLMQKHVSLDFNPSRGCFPYLLERKRQHTIRELGVDSCGIDLIGQRKGARVMTDIVLRIDRLEALILSEI